MTLTFATGCSGIGAPEVAFGDRLGWKCLWCSEIEPFPSAVLKYRGAGKILLNARMVHSTRHTAIQCA